MANERCVKETTWDCEWNREREETQYHGPAVIFLFAFLVTSHVCNQDGRVHPPRRPFLHYLAQTQEACSAFAIGDACFSLWKFAFVRAQNTLFLGFKPESNKFFEILCSPSFSVGETFTWAVGKGAERFSQPLLIYCGQKNMAFLSSHFKFECLKFILHTFSYIQMIYIFLVP